MNFLTKQMVLEEFETNYVYLEMGILCNKIVIAPQQ